MSLPVDQQLAILAILDAFLLQKCLYLGQIRRVTGHIRRQYDAYKALSEGLEVIPREILKKIILLSIEEKKGLCRMIVLLNALITVADCALWHFIHVEGVCEPIVTKVMADGTDADWECIKFTDLGEIDDLALRQEYIAHL